MVVLRRYCSWICVCLVAIAGLFAGISRAAGQETTPTPPATPLVAAILSPLPGEAIQGNFSIVANTAIIGYKSAELSFGYASDSTHTWFLIAQGDAPVSSGKLADWDTSVLTDGNYTLQLTVTKEDGTSEVTQVANLRVRNYTPVETDTPTPSATPAPGKLPTQTLTPTPTSTPVYVTPTPLPVNPIQLSSQDVLSGLLRGALGIIALFAIFSLYRSIRKALRS